MCDHGLIRAERWYGVWAGRVGTRSAGRLIERTTGVAQATQSMMLCLSQVVMVRRFPAPTIPGDDAPAIPEGDISGDLHDADAPLISAADAPVIPSTDDPVIPDADGIDGK